MMKCQTLQITANLQRKLLYPTSIENKDLDELTAIFKDFARAYIDPSLKESTEYMLFLAKWFGDSKPST